MGGELLALTLKVREDDGAMAEDEVGEVEVEAVM